LGDSAAMLSGQLICKPYCGIVPMSGPCEWVFDHLALPAPPGSVLQILNVRVIVVEVTRGQQKCTEWRKPKKKTLIQPRSPIL